MQPFLVPAAVGDRTGDLDLKEADEPLLIIVSSKVLTGDLGVWNLVSENSRGNSAGSRHQLDPWR